MVATATPTATDVRPNDDDDGKKLVMASTTPFNCSFFVADPLYVFSHCKIAELGPLDMISAEMEDI